MTSLPDIPPKEQPQAEQAQARPILSTLLELFQTLLLAAALFLMVNALTARIRVEGPSMESNLFDSDVVIVNRLAYRWDTPERGDIIVFHYPLDPDRRLIKRVIGLPGDEIHIQGDQVYINDAPLNEPYLSPRTDEGAEPLLDSSWILEDDEVFVMGDNRDHSHDSRHWGALSIPAIIGKAVFIYWPPSQIGPIPHVDLPLP